MVKVGDKVRYTGVTKLNVTKGNIYQVAQIDNDGKIQGIAVFDDIGDHYWLYNNDYEPVTEETEYNYAEQAAKHGIMITVELANGNVISFDGTS